MHAVRTFLIAIAAVALFAASAAAQGTTVTNEEFNVSVDRPEGWVDVEGNDRAVFNFKHEESHSQIEIIGTQLMTADVADVFFETFHETLTSSEFVQTGREDKSYGDHTGTETLYEFTHSGVTLKVAVFQFVEGTTAWLAVAYMQEDAFDTYTPTYREVVGSMAFAE